MLSKLSTNKIIISLAIILIGNLFCLTVQAADLKIKLANSTYQVGDTVAVKIILVSTDQSANALSGNLSFPADKLSVSSLDKTGSLVNIWTQAPSFSNPNGQVSFEGAIFNPGYMGASGQILTVVFKAKKVGVVNLAFGSGAVLASDGAGTAILKNLGRASFSIVEAEKVQTPPVPKIISVPVATTSEPEIISVTGFFPDTGESDFSTTEPWWASLFSYFGVWPHLLILLLSLFVLILLIILVWLIKSWRQGQEVIIEKPDFGTMSLGQPAMPVYYQALAPTAVGTLATSSALALAVFSGRAYPGNDVSVLLNDQVLAKTRTGLDGRFEISFDHLVAGNYNFSLKAVDNLTHQTTTQVFPMTLTAGVTIRTTDIFLVPSRPDLGLT